MISQLDKNSTTEERKAVVESALGSVRAEGFEPTNSAKELMRVYVEGQITVDELIEKAKENIKKQTEQAS